MTKEKSKLRIALKVNGELAGELLNKTDKEIDVGKFIVTLIFEGIQEELDRKMCEFDSEKDMTLEVTINTKPRKE